MKKLAILLTTLFLAVSTSGAVAAFADSAQTVYPADGEFIKPLVFTSLTDYAVCGEEFVFAEEKNVYLYSEGSNTVYTFDDKVTNVDVEDGKFVIKAGKTYSLPEKNECEHSFYTAQEIIADAKFTYHYNAEGALCAYNMSTMAITVFGTGFGNLKRFEGSVYAVKDNALFAINGDKSAQIELEYADFSATAEIVVGQAPELLKAYGAVKFVEVNKGAYMTEVDLITLNADHFVTGRTIRLDESKTALLLCYTGNAAVIAMGDTAYITLKSKVKEKNVTCTTECEFKNAMIIGDKIYASPYVIVGTATASEVTGKIVEVVNKYEFTGVLGSAFYEVRFESDDGVVLGYVAEGFLTEFIIEDNKPPVEVQDPDYNDKNDVKTTLLILLVIVLVLIAVGYIAFVGTSDKKKSAKKENEKPQSENK